MPGRLAPKYGPVVSKPGGQRGQPQHVERLALAEARGDDQVERIADEKTDRDERGRQQRVTDPARPPDHGSGTAAFSSFCRLARIASVGCEEDSMRITARLKRVANSL